MEVTGLAGGTPSTTLGVNNSLSTGSYCGGQWTSMSLGIPTPADTVLLKQLAAAAFSDAS
eukprot:2229290-Rhodomonas_salina.1